MTEHRKIPLTPETSADGGKGENSSIERAVDTFDLRHFLPPAVPEVLPAVAPRLANRARRIPMSDLGADISGIAASPVGETTADAPVVVEASSELVTFPERKSRIKPVVFSGTHHPIDRKRLREQGKIVPEGSVTGLLEEFRIVKRQVLLMAAQLREEGIRQVNQRDGRPAVFYFHPWKIDPEQPRVNSAPLKSRLRHYTNLDGMAGKLRQLVLDFRWGRMDVLAARELSLAGPLAGPIAA